MICCVIANCHEMVGVDLHDSHLTLATPAASFGPHIVNALVRFPPWFMASDKETDKVVMSPGNAISKMFDIGFLIPHVPLVPSAYCWLYTLTSSSQGHFGVTSVQTEKGPIAAALMLYSNPQLHCEGPLLCPPAPTGAVLAPNTVVAGMSIGDVIGGYVTMALTSAVAFGLARLLDKAIPAVASGIMDSLVRVVSPRIMLPATVLGVALTKAFPRGTALGREIAEAVIEWGIGSPMAPSIKSVGEDAGKWVDKTVGTSEYFDNAVLLPPYPLGPFSVPLLVRVQ